MRACMVAYTFYETDNRVRRYAETLAKRGDEVDAVALRRDGQPDFEIIRGVRVYRIQERRVNETGPLTYLIKLLLFFIRSMWFLAKHSIPARYDCIHVHSVPDFEVFAAFIPWLLGTRIILDIHDIVPEFYASKFKVSQRSIVFRLLIFAEKLSTAFADHVIISNHLWGKKLIQRSVPARKCSVIINYPDPSIFFPRPRKAPHDGFLLCYPGTLNSHQGIDVAVLAVEKLRGSQPRVKLLIVGDGPDRDTVKRLVEEHNLNDDVTLQGFVPLEHVSEIIADADLGVVPKRRDSFGDEAFSTKIMEFMMMNVPVVASETTIDRYYFNDELIQFFESGNSEDLAAKVLDLARNKAKRDALSASAKTFVDANTWDVKKHEYLDIVDRLTSKGSLVRAAVKN
jgi:glycosyltransferase involved in cell wall biosynthesis